MTTKQTQAVAHLREKYPQALVEDSTTGEGTTVRVIDLAGWGGSGDEFIVGPTGQVIDLGFVIPDHAGSQGIVPRAELILKDPPEAGWELRPAG